MRRHLPLLLVLLLVATTAVSSVLLEPVNNWFSGWFKTRGFDSTWGRIGLILTVVLMALLYYLWLQRQGRNEASNISRLDDRRALMEKILEFAQSHFDGGLYGRARKEFQLSERPLRLFTRGNQRLASASQSTTGHRTGRC
jgi:predicted PurR-regulated permease PerM